MVHRVVRDGMVVGLIAYAAVAVFYAAFDLLAARGSLYTVDLLGKAVFRGLRDRAVLEYPIQPDLAAIFWYNGLHLLISLAIGLMVTRLVDQAERRPAQAPVILLAIAGGFVVTVLGVSRLTAAMRPVLPWWSIVVANAVATMLAATYLLRTRPRLWGRLTRFAR
jgi:hypothetical protein